MGACDSTPFKSCTKCGSEKSISDFNKSKTGKYGVRAQCKACVKTIEAARYAADPGRTKARQQAYRAANPEKVKAANAAYQAKNSEKIKAYVSAWSHANTEKIKARKAELHAANPEKRRARAAAYYAANKESVAIASAAWASANMDRRRATRSEWSSENKDRIRAVNAAWRAANPDKNRIYISNRVSRKRANGGVLSKNVAARLMGLQRGLCACGCGAKLKETGYHIDHRIPLVKGGPNTDANCQLLTPACNQSKGAKCPIDFMQSRGFLL